MSSHNKKLTHIAGPPEVILECSCGDFTRKATGGSRNACEERLNVEYEKHLREAK